MENRIVHVNGKWINNNDAVIPFNDAGFTYGDGVFETLRFFNRTLFRPEKHLQRLHTGLDVLNMSISKSNTEIISILENIIDKNTLDIGTVRLMITRGNITDNPWNHKGVENIYVAIRGMSKTPTTPVKIVYLQEENYPLIRFNPAIKSMNYVGNMLAKNEAEKQGGFEPVFINRNGIITECAIRNVFYVKNNTLITPSLDLGILPGITRDTIIEIAKEIGLAVVESHISFADVNSMDEAFISSSGIGLLPCYWDGWSSNYKLSLKLQEKLIQLIENI
jgi:branched-chain amino acid aminotransferase